MKIVGLVVCLQFVESNLFDNPPAKRRISKKKGMI
jgi:hypothetical protein